MRATAKVRVKITERGWPAHLCVGHWCRFKRNTLLAAGRQRIVVSTVGAYFPPRQGEQTDPVTTIGVDRFYETMAFKAKYEAPYWEADAHQELSFKSQWRIDHHANDTDALANLMHDKVVAEFKLRLEFGAKF